jgi:tetrahydromethanopterin S-methyltransferase subunit D
MVVVVVVVVAVVVGTVVVVGMVVVGQHLICGCVCVDVNMNVEIDPITRPTRRNAVAGSTAMPPLIVSLHPG